MAKPTLQEVFGPGATQTATTITIAKADLPDYTPTFDDGGEKVFAGIFVRAKTALTTTGLDSNPDQSISVEDSFESLPTRNDKVYRRNTQSVNFDELVPASRIIPNNY